MTSPSSGRLVLAAFAIMAVLATIPLFAVTYPPLQDLPNHLGRIVVLKAPPGDPLLSAYEPAWQVVPYLGTDILLIALSSVMPMTAAAKVLFALCATAWLAGPVLLHRAVYGRYAVMPLVAGFLLFNRVVDFGFMSFWLGTGLMVVGLAIWIFISHRPFWFRAVTGVAISIVLFFSHLFALGGFALAIAIWELFAPRRDGGPTLWSRCALLALVLLPGPIGLWLGPDSLTNAARSFAYAGSTFGEILSRKLATLNTFVSGGPAINTAAMLLLAGLALLTLFMRPNLRLMLICLAFVAAFLLLPYNLMTATHVDWRTLAPLALLIAAWISVERVRLMALVAAVIIPLLFGAQIWVVTQSWTNAEALYQQFAQLTPNIPEGSRLLYVSIGDRNGRLNGSASPSVLHYAGYAVVERGALVPSLFALPSPQPLRIAPNYRPTRAEFSNGWFKEITDIDWTKVEASFDYMMIAAKDAQQVPANLREIGSAPSFTLYEVTAP